MPEREVLIMAVTRMLSGVCTAGLGRERHPASHLAWIRPVKPYDSLLVGDITDATGRIYDRLVAEFGRALSLQRLGRHPEAAIRWRAFLERAPNDPYAPAARAALRAAEATGAPGPAP